MKSLYSNFSLPASVGALYIKKYFKPEIKQYVIDMVNNIRHIFLDILHKITWMDEQTKKSAIEKAKTLTVHIGYPDELTDTKLLEKYYSEISMDEDNYFNNVIQLAQYKINYAFNKLREPVNKTSWEQRSMPAIANAFYSPIENSIRKYKEISMVHN